MSTDVHAAGTPISVQEEQIFGKKGFGLGHFSPETLARAIVSVMNKIDFDRLRGFSDVDRVMNYTEGNRRFETAYDTVKRALAGSPYMRRYRESEQTIRLGEWRAKLGLVPRSRISQPTFGSECEYVLEEEWVERLMVAGGVKNVPLQVSSVYARFGVLCSNNRLYFGNLVWQGRLDPRSSYPFSYRLNFLEFTGEVNLRIESATCEFLEKQGKEAASAILTSLESALDHSNRSMESDLVRNRGAAAHVKKIIERIS